jgi:hypothetical protein
LQLPVPAQRVLLLAAALLPAWPRQAVPVAQAWQEAKQGQQPEEARRPAWRQPVQVLLERPERPSPV